MEGSSSPGSENCVLPAAKWCFPEDYVLPHVTSAKRGKQMLPLAKMWGKKTVGTQQAECTVAVTCFKLHKNNSLKVWN